MRLVSSLVNTSVRLFKAAKEKELEGDDETAYVFYMRYMDAFDAVKKHKDYAIDKVSMLPT